jgi:ribosomal protein L44E
LAVYTEPIADWLCPCWCFYCRKQTVEALEHERGKLESELAEMARKQQELEAKLA